MKTLPEEISVVIIKHRVKLYQNNPGLVEKMIIAGKEIKPGLIITPQFSFPNEDCVNEAYDILKKQSPNTVLVTARNNPLIKTPEPDFDPLESLDYQVLVYPYDDKRFLNLDLLVTYGEPEQNAIVRDVASLRTGGCLIRMKNNNMNVAVEKIDINGNSVIDLKFPISHNNSKAFDLYLLKLD
jgi:hypothetical protein